MDTVMDPDSLQAVLALLSSKQPSDQCVGLMALASLDKNKCHRDNAVAKGALPLLVLLLKSAHPKTQHY